MSKKNFKTGFESLLGEERTHKTEKTAKDISKPNTTRATFIIEVDQLESIKTIAYWDRKSFKNVLSEALKLYIDDYIEKNGKIEPAPQDQ